MGSQGSGQFPVSGRGLLPEVDVLARPPHPLRPRRTKPIVSIRHKRLKEPLSKKKKRCHPDRFPYDGAWARAGHVRYRLRRCLGGIVCRVGHGWSWTRIPGNSQAPFRHSRTPRISGKTYLFRLKPSNGNTYLLLSILLVTIAPLDSRNGTSSSCSPSFANGHAYTNTQPHELVLITSFYPSATTHDLSVCS